MGLALKRQVARLTHSDNALLSSDIPKEHLYATLFLRVSGILTVTAAITLRENNILNLIKNIQIKMEGAVTLKNFSGVNAFLAAKYEDMTQPVLSAPATADGANAFNAVIPISFALPPSYSQQNRFSTLMDSSLFKSLQILITTGDADDIFSAGTATLSSVVYEIQSSELTGITNRIVDSNFESQQDKNFTSASTNLEHEMPVDGSLYRRFGIRVNDNGAQSDAMLNRIKLKANGTNILVDLAWDELLDINKRVYRQESLSTGYAILNLDERFLGAEMINTKKLSSLTLVYDVDASTAGIIEVVPSTLVMHPSKIK